MSKELTEKWKNRTLYGGWYFLEFENGSILPVYYCGFNREFEFRWDWKISKVLAPVPTYEEWEELQESNDGLSKLMFKSLMNRFVKADEERERLEKENYELTTKCNQLEKKVKKRGMQIERAYDRYVAKRKENSELVQKIHILNEANMNLENTVGKFGEQLNEANEVVKYYANSFFGDKQKDGTYLIYTRENALGRVDVTYNPNIANNYLEKWGVK